MPNEIKLYSSNSYFPAGYVAEYKTTKIHHIDLANRRIYLNPGVTNYHPVEDLYKEIRFIRQQDESLRVMQIPISAGGNINKGGGKYTPRYAVFNNGWRVVPFNASHSLYIEGEQITDDGQSGPACLDTTLLDASVNVIIHYEPPAAEIVVLNNQQEQLEYSSFNGGVTLNQTLFTNGVIYPVGTPQTPVNNLTDAKTIATERGFDTFYLKANTTIGATDIVTALRFKGEGATLNVSRTTVTLVQGCVTTNSQWFDCKITGYQGGESLYHDCIIDGLDNAHCIYERCGLLDGTSRGYTIRQTSAVSSGHASYFKECYSDEGTAILDRNGARLNVTFDGFHGRLKIINQNHATSSGQCWIHMNGGTLTVDSSCTKGKITVTGFGALVNNSLGTEVDASGFAAEVAYQARLDIESLRSSHQGFGYRWYVDPVNGSDLSPGNSPASPVKTLTTAIAKAVSGRGDVIFLLSPGSGTSVINERVVLNKEDLHIRAPGRGLQIQPSTIASEPVINITANNCSLNGILIRTSNGGSEDGIVVNAKFCRLENLYVVGPDNGGVTPVGNGVGIHFKGGDYHKVFGCEIEKFGTDGVRFTDAPIGSEGSPREVRFDNCNIYYNRGSGIAFTGTSSNSTRLNLVTDSRIQHNGTYGIYIGPNTQRTMVLSTNYIKDNGTYPTGDENPANEIFIDPLASDPMVSVEGGDLASVPQRVWEYAQRTLSNGTVVSANVVQINGTTVKGNGTEGNKWRG